MASKSSIAMFIFIPSFTNVYGADIPACQFSSLPPAPCASKAPRRSRSSCSTSPPRSPSPISARGKPALSLSKGRQPGGEVRLSALVRPGLLLAPAQLHRDLDQRVLLAADELAPAALEQDLSRVDAEAFGGALGVQQEARVDAGIAQRQRRAVDDLGPRHDRPHRLVSRVDELEPVDAADVHAPAVEHGGADSQRGGARAGAQPGAAAVDVGSALLDGGEAVRDGGAEVVVGVHADGDAEALRQGADAGAKAVRRERPGRVGDGDAGGAGG